MAQDLGQPTDRNPFNEAGTSGAQVEVSEFLTVDLHAQSEDLANVLQMLSVQSRRNIVVSKDVSATVNANLYDVTIYEALDAILNVNGYGYIERGNFIFVYTLEEIARIEQANRKPVSKVLRLSYLNANDAAEFVAPLLSEVGQIKTNGDVGSFTISEKTPMGDESFALAATLVVFDYPEHIEEIEKLVAQLDTRPSQVLVEATILQTALTEANAFGIDFSIIGDVDFTDFITTGGPLSAANALVRGGDGETGLSPADNKARAATSSPGNTGGPATFKLGVINDDFSIFLRLLDEVTDVSILSNPKLLTLNRQPARVLVGERIGFLNTTSTETSTTQTVQFLDTGTQLSFRPFISTDGMIRMELSPSVSEGVIRSATDVTGANVSIPDEITQELTTNVLVRDGATIVLGGLFKETTTLERRQVPVLGDLPLVGAAFRGHDDSTKRSEIIFMIKPTIMSDDVLIEQGERGIAYGERIRAGTRSALLPWSRDRMTSLLNVEAERLALEGESRKALWTARRSLELNPNQPDAIDLRERLVNERELWPSRSLIDRVIDREATNMLEQIEPVSAIPMTPAWPFPPSHVPEREWARMGGSGAKTEFAKANADFVGPIQPTEFEQAASIDPTFFTSANAWAIPFWYGDLALFLMENPIEYTNAQIEAAATAQTPPVDGRELAEVEPAFDAADFSGLWRSLRALTDGETDGPVDGDASGAPPRKFTQAEEGDDDGL